MSFPRYPKYKSSGVEWLGDVPEGWDVIPFKHRCSRYALYGANMSSDEYVPDGVRFLRTTDINENGELEPDGVFVSRDAAREYLLNDKDILISRSGTIGRAFVFSTDVHPECAYAGYLVRFVPTKQLNSRLFFYFTKSAPFGDWLQTQLIFSTIGNVNGQKYAQCRLPLPPLPEQTTIAEFLDRETGKIDELVAEQRRLMELLKEKRQAVISHAVTKGVNPHAPLKPSGIEWLGEVPEGWTVTVIKRFSTLQRGHDLTDAQRTEGPYPVVTSGGVNGTHGAFMARGPGVVTGRYGSTGRLFYIDDDYWPHNTALYVSDFHGNSPRFVWYSLQTVDFAAHSAKAAVPGIDRNDIHVLPVAVPPKHEQAVIVEFLEAELAKFDTLTAEAQRAIELLQERRTALISAAVTGQIDVRQPLKN